MAILFLLAVNFPTIETAEIAGDIVEEHPPFVINGEPDEISGSIREYESSEQHVGWFELTVGLAGLGYTGFVGEVTASEVTQAGELFYKLLERFDGYNAAIVGWNPEPLVDPRDFPHDVADGFIYEKDGLVLSNKTAETLALDNRFIPFHPGYRWLPYTGDSAP